MKKGVFSMYATKEKKHSFYQQENLYPKYRDTEIGAKIAFSISENITGGIKRGIKDLSVTVVKAGTFNGKR